MAFYINNIIVEKLTKSNAVSLDVTSTATTAGTLTLTIDSTVQQVLTGSTSGQNVKLPDATTLSIGHSFIFWNESTEAVTIQDNTPSSQLVLPAGQRAVFTLLANGSAAGTWAYAQIHKSVLSQKAGRKQSVDFSGNPKTAAVVFDNAYANTDYSIVITGTDARAWSWESKSVSGFTINANANQALTGDVLWQTSEYGQAI
jgi:hypothetical protein